MKRTLAAAIALITFAANAADGDLVKRGEYLARAGDCVACHTAPAGKRMAGGLSIPTPVGTIVSTNITPSRAYGIGDYTLDEFGSALRAGVRRDGRRLYPAMPYTAYALVTDDDVKALYAYFMQGVAPVDASPPETNLPFPFNVRLSMAAWNVLFLTGERFRPEPARSAQWNRGAYLVRGLAHCGACHTPRNLLMAEKSSLELGGGAVGPWYAPNITSDPNSGVGGWTAQELVEYMARGHVADKAQAAGPMAEAIDNSLRYLSEDDLDAVAVYLKSVPPLHDAMATRPAYSWGEPADDLKSVRGEALPSLLDQMSGPQLYDAYCASCHQAQAQGSFDGGMPSLFHNAALGRTNTNNLVMVMLAGIERGEAHEVRMPGLEHELSDVQLATLGSYLTQRYGNPQAAISPGQAAKGRRGGGDSGLVVAVQTAMSVAGLVVIAALVLLLRRRRSAE
jgi:mono/diheme cytochrome c family protein